MNCRTRTIAALILSLAAGGIACAQTPVDSGWTYQGKLKDGANAASGSYDLRFTLFADPVNATQIGVPQERLAVDVQAGLFTANLNFGAQFTGFKRWVQVEVRPAGVGTYTVLSPRQEVTSAPQSLFSQSSQSAQFSQAPWATSGSSISYNAGNVGIGTATPTSRVEIAAQDGLAITGFQPFLTLRDTNAGNARGVIASGSGDLSLYPNSFIGGFAAMTVKNTSGNVGIGTATPSSRLHVLGSPSNTFPFLVECNGTAAGSNAIRAVLNAGASNNFSSAVTAINNQAPGAGLLQFGVYATAAGAGQAVRGDSTSGVGVVGTTTSTAGYGGYFVNTAVGGYALWADGPMQCKTLRILGGSDLAEPFDVNAAGDQKPEPGMVVVIDEDHPGELRLACAEYDTKVAGVVSGANDLQPGMVMKAEGQAHADGQQPIAMTGRVWCWVDASFGAIRPGDRLTTSPTAGHAMKAADSVRCPGAVIGKAMTELKDGKGLVLVLVNLQ